MKNKKQKKCEEEACCAHRRVVYKRIDNADGTCSDSWICDLNCGAKFYPVYFTPTESTTRKALHDPDCYKIGGKKDCSLKGNGTNPKKFAGCYETYVPTNPDLFADASKKYEEWEQKLDNVYLTSDLGSRLSNLRYLIRQEKEKSYQVGCKFGIDIAEKQFEAGRHSAYREMEEAAETDFQRLIIKNLKAKLIQK